ncbi:MAG TPA: hypothetical protein VN806_03690 [Caulobacteraceae bacterium]|nr:hypothetical protein [Caulobacteraceae bacterium]
MILYVPPNAPAVIKDAAAVILVAHIGGGSLGVVSGFTAFLTRKGGVVHRLAGDIFVVSTLVMASIGAVVSPFLPTPQPGNIAGGVLTLYVVATGWATARRPDGSLGVWQTAATAVPLLAIPVLVTFGVIAWNAPGHELVGVPFVAPFAFAVIAAVLAGSDVSVMLRGALNRAERLSRHLWRMGLGLLMATGSALGQPRITHLIPLEFRTLPIMLAPIVLILGLMIFWLVRVRLSGRRAARRVSAPVMRRATA